MTGDVGSELKIEDINPVYTAAVSSAVDRQVNYVDFCKQFREYQVSSCGLAYLVSHCGPALVCNCGPALLTRSHLYRS